MDLINDQFFKDQEGDSAEVLAFNAFARKYDYTKHPAYATFTAAKN